MSAATMQPPPVPPRPSRSHEKDNGTSAPSIPPRPVNRRLQRSVSPNPDRFAPSPLNETSFISKTISKSPTRSARFSPGSVGMTADPIDRASSVDLPSIGQEGQEYAAVTHELEDQPTQEERRRSLTPEHTRTVAEDLKLFAPKPTMPQQSAKQRVLAVTRTDSDRAAAFGIGKPSIEEPYPRSIKKKASTASQLSQSDFAEDEHGIPEIGQQVPMYPNAGDVQAPTPALPSEDVEGRGKTSRNQGRPASRTGNKSIPPGSYGLHGHGVTSADTKLDKAYYEKHPELKDKEHLNHLHDLVNDYSKSSDELNKLVRDSAGRGAGFGTSAAFAGFPSEEVGFQATEEYTSRMTSPRPPSAAAPRHSEPNLSSTLRKTSFSAADLETPHGVADEVEDDEVIHVDEPHNQGFLKFGDEQEVAEEGVEEEYQAPILASDEIAKDPSTHDLRPAVEPHPERSSSAFGDKPKSRPSSRPASVYSPPILETPQASKDDEEEYEPLFTDDDQAGQKPLSKAEKIKANQRFPSRDIWEDAPNSVYTTAEVHTPDLMAELQRQDVQEKGVPPRDTETPAQAFARQQEELAESEDRSPDHLLHRKDQARPQSWIEHHAQQQPDLAPEMHPRPAMAHRFPSRDVWEDTPESHRLETTVSTPQREQEPQSAGAESMSHAKPAVPPRPPRKQSSGDDKPAVPGRPKPQIPARPAKPTSVSKGPEVAPKQKPAVPARPMGGKIAALQAGFMSDLNKRLQLGPQAPKKEALPEEEVVEEKKEKGPLRDARKGRARGPQRRAPTRKTSAGPPPVSDNGPVLSFSTTRTLWSIDEEGTMNFDGDGENGEETPVEETHLEETSKLGEITKPEEAHTETARQEEPKPVETTKIEDVTPEEESKPSTKLSEPETLAEGEGEPTDAKKAEEMQAEEEMPSKAEEEKPSEEAKSQTAADEHQETKTLVTNTAGESILEETVEKKDEGDQVKEVEAAKDEGGEQA